jgi:peptide/nickel transport system permease protein
MLTYLSRRLAVGAVTVVAISVISFVIIQLPPGDFVTSYLAELAANGSASAAIQADKLRADYGLDQPVYIQYARWIGHIVRGDFGMSLSYGRPVAEVIGDRLPMTIVVSLAAALFTYAVSLPIGILSAVRQYSVLDYLFTFVGFLGLAIPSFLLALAMMYFGFQFFHISIGGLFSPAFVDAPWSVARVIDLLGHLFVPAVVLGLGSSAQLIRVMRANLLDELGKPYVVTARAKGLSERDVILKYPVRIALNPFASSIAFVLPQLVSGTIIISIVLSLPTVGPLLLQALLSQDMFLAGTIVLLVGVVTVIGTLISDLVLAWIDPRVRFAD